MLVRRVRSRERAQRLLRSHISQGRNQNGRRGSPPTFLRKQPGQTRAKEPCCAAVSAGRRGLFAASYGCDRNARRTERRSAGAWASLGPVQGWGWPANTAGSRLSGGATVPGTHVGSGPWDVSRDLDAASTRNCDVSLRRRFRKKAGSRPYFCSTLTKIRDFISTVSGLPD